MTLFVCGFYFSPGHDHRPGQCRKMAPTKHTKNTTGCLVWYFITVDPTYGKPNTLALDTCFLAAKLSNPPRYCLIRQDRCQMRICRRATRQAEGKTMVVTHIHCATNCIPLIPPVRTVIAIPTPITIGVSASPKPTVLTIAIDMTIRH